MEQVVLQAAHRDKVGKGAARALRREGLIPGVVYGLGQETMTISVSRERLEVLMTGHAGSNVLLDLRVEGAETSADTGALLKDMQKHPVTRAPESVDFQWVSLSEKVAVAVPIVFEGTSQAQIEGAVIDQILYEVNVSCLPLQIPDSLVISIEGMVLHETRTAEMLQMPEGIDLLVESDEAVVTCTPPAKIVETVDEELEDELDELAEGEEGEEGEEGAEPSGEQEAEDEEE